MIIDTRLAKAFNKAVTDLDNIHEGTMEGQINWNFVDADVYMDLGQNYIAHMGTQLLSDQFNYLVDCFNDVISVTDRILVEAA